MKTTTIHVRDGHEYATFFVEESEVVPRPDGKGVQASATWTAHSSYGTYGHHWSSMGEPFAEFIKGVDEHYLLGKIASKRTNSDLASKEIRRQVIERRKSKAITKEQAQEAMDAVDSCEAEGEAEVCCHLLYMSDELHNAGVCFDDITTQEYQPSAVNFTKRLWPKFVEAMNKIEPAMEVISQ